jgi:hypothetical protein
MYEFTWPIGHQPDSLRLSANVSHGLLYILDRHPTKVSHKLDSPSILPYKNYFTSSSPKCLHVKLDSSMAKSYIDSGRTVPQQDILLEGFQNGWS